MIILGTAVVIIAAAAALYFLPVEAEIPPQESLVEKPSEDMVQTEPEQPEKPEEKTVEKPTEPVIDKGPKEIFRTGRDKLLSIEIEKNGQTLILDKEEGEWIVNKGSAGRLLINKIEEKIGGFLTINTLKTISLNPSKEELDDFGLRIPAEKIRIKTAEGLLTLLLGSSSLQEQGTYMQIAGSREVYLISNSVGGSLKIELDDIRNRKIDLFDVNGIESMTIRNSSTIKIIPFEQTDMFTRHDYDFMMEEPYRAYVPVGRNEMTGLLGAFNHPLEIKNFIDSGEPEDFGLTSSSQMISVTEKSGKVFELLIGKDYDSALVYGKLKGEKQLFTLAKEDLPFLKTEAYDLTDKIPHLIDGDKIDSFTITTGEMAIMCDIERRDGRNIYLVNGMAAEKDSFFQLFDQAVSIRTSGEIRGSAEWGKAEMTLSFKLRDGGSHWTHLYFQPMDNSRLAVSRNEDTPLFYVSRVDLEKAIDNIIKVTDRIMGF